MSETPLAPSEGFADLRSEVIERGEVTPKKIGRPKGSKTKNKQTTVSGASSPAKADAPAPDFLPVETVVEMVALPFSLYANRKGEHWRLTDEEKKQIGQLTAKVVNKNVPEWLARWGDEIALAGVLSMVVAGRILVDLELSRQPAKSYIPQLGDENAPNA